MALIYLRTVYTCSTHLTISKHKKFNKLILLNEKNWIHNAYA